MIDLEIEILADIEKHPELEGMKFYATLIQREVEINLSMHEIETGEERHTVVIDIDEFEDYVDDNEGRISTEDKWDWASESHYTVDTTLDWQEYYEADSAKTDLIEFCNKKIDELYAENTWQGQL